MALAKGLRSAATALSRSALRQEAIFGQIRVVSGSAPCAAQELNSETSSQTVGESQVRQVSPHFKSNITGGEYFMSTPVYTSEELDRVVPRHRPTESLRDRVANSLVAAARRLFDWITDYGEGKMDERKWLTRFIFLESVAGVPGMVGGAVRHLRSIGLLRRDHGWINTLLSEAENERMHLMTFMRMRDPGLLMRFNVLIAQGVFFNLFFTSYLLSPRTCHRFVGYLEEQARSFLEYMLAGQKAVSTYTHALKDYDEGHLPEWHNKAPPQFAIEYWQLGEEATVRDLLNAVRADEAHHCHANHTFASCHPDQPNPFAQGRHELPEDYINPPEGFAPAYERRAQ